MSNKTGIEWTDATWNPVTGCNKVSAGCKHCYAERDWNRLVHLPAYAGRDFTDVQTHGERLDQPLRWQKPRMIFVNSMSDLFHDDVPFEFIAAVFGVMSHAQHHTFQVLTKRPKRMVEFFAWLSQQTQHKTAWVAGVNRAEFLCGEPKGERGAEATAVESVAVADYYDRAAIAIGGHSHGTLHDKWPLPNVWLGVSVEDQAAADERIPLLLDTPAAVRWISAEPLLGPVNLRHLNEDRETNEIDALQPWTWEQEVEAWRGTSETWEDDFEDFHSCTVGEVSGTCHNAIDWVVVGGESGPKARPMHPDWARSLRDQCAAAGVPFLFKQHGEWIGDDDIDNANLRTPEIADADLYFRTHDWPDNSRSYRIGKKAAGRFLDGVRHDGYPAQGCAA